MALTSEGALLTDQHRRRQVRLAIAADSRARRMWDSTLDLNDLEGSQPVWRETMLDLLQTWWQISAADAGEYLPRFREAETGVADGIEVRLPRFDRRHLGRQLEWAGMRNVLWHIALGQTQEAAYAAARTLFIGMFHEAVLTGGRTTIEKWAKKDPRAIGWRRVSDGRPCAFCAMLVSRGPVYTSRGKALSTRNPARGIPEGTLHKYHPHCGCTIELVYGDWQPTEREQQWIDDYYRNAESLPKGEPRTWDRILPRMRQTGDYRDSASYRSTPEFLAQRRRKRFEKKIADLSRPERSKPKEPSSETIKWPDNVQPPSETVANHILHGDGDGKRGGHLYGTGVIGKTEFPEDWSEEDVLRAISQVMADPDWTVPAKNEHALHWLGKTINDVQVEVKAYMVDGKYVINQAYPVGGNDVTRNTLDGKVEAKPSKAKRWGEGSPT